MDEERQRIVNDDEGIVHRVEHAPCVGVRKIIRPWYFSFYVKCPVAKSETMDKDTWTQAFQH